MRIGLGTSRTTLTFQDLNHRDPRRRKGRARNWKPTWKNNGELPWSGKGNRLPGSPGSSESPKEIGSKEEHPSYLIIINPRLKIRRES